MGRRKDLEQSKYSFCSHKRNLKGLPLSGLGGTEHTMTLQQYLVIDKPLCQVSQFHWTTCHFRQASLDCVQKPILLLQITLILPQPHRQLIQSWLLHSWHLFNCQSNPPVGSGKGKETHFQYQKHRGCYLVYFCSWCFLTAFHLPTRAWDLFPGGPVKQQQT